MLVLGYNMYMLGYRKGRTAILDLLKGGQLNRLIEVASIIGLMVVGNMAVSRVAVHIPVEWVFTNELGKVTLNLQTGVLDALLPGILPLGITLGVWGLLKKRMKPLTIILLNLRGRYRLLAAWHPRRIDPLRSRRGYLRTVPAPYLLNRSVP